MISKSVNSRVAQFPPEAELEFRKLEALWLVIDKELTLYPHLDWKGDLRFLALVSITAAAHRLVRGVIAGVNGGSVDNLTLAVRSLIEAMINVKYIIEDDTQMRARAYLVHDSDDRIKALNKMIGLIKKGKGPSMSKLKTVEEYEKRKHELEEEKAGFQEKWGKENLKWPKLSEMAEKTDVEELYVGVIWLLSQDAHLTARGLDRFMKQEDDGGLVIKLGQDLDGAYMGLSAIRTTYTALLNECSTHLGSPKKSTIEPFDIPPSSLITHN